MKLVIQTPSGPAAEALLHPGVNRVGRSANNDVAIAHPSVSGIHCEILLENEQLSVRDLNSTNGTFIEGARVQSAQLQPGQTLRLGEVNILPSTEVATTKPAAAPSLRLSIATKPPENDSASSTTTGQDELPPLPPPVPRPAPSGIFSSRPKKNIPPFSRAAFGAFGYPLRENGPFILIAGAIFLAVVSVLTTFGFGIVARLLGVACTGYVFLFLQSIITTTANGDDYPPGWPDWTDWWETGVKPYLTMLGIWVFCLGPAWACSSFASDGPTVLTIGGTEFSNKDLISIALLGLGALYLPMAFLATAMYDSLGALNPLLVIASIARVPAPYAGVCGLLAVLCIGDIALLATMDSFFHSWILATIVGRFLALYSFMAAMRLLGLLYLTKGDRLAWSFK
jgi:pSer/pThr/pTyr-binding forkhead associated (FHA) protein